jgi:hypothetical protein
MMSSGRSSAGRCDAIPRDLAHAFQVSTDEVLGVESICYVPRAATVDSPAVADFAPLPCGTLRGGANSKPVTGKTTRKGFDAVY